MATSTKTVTTEGASQSEGSGKADTKKRVVVRSPRSPSITFKEAVDKAKVIYQHENRAATTPLVIFQHLGFKKKTGPAGRMLAALGQYGLLEKKGVANYSVSNKAFRLFNLPEDAPEREQIQRELAMRPLLFREIVAKYRSTGLPSDSTLKSYLVIDRGFNSGSVEEFLKVFKAAIDVAKPFDEAYTPGGETEEEEEDEDLEGMDTETQQTKQKTVVMQPIPKGQLPFPLYLSQSQKAMLYVPASMTRKEYDLLKKQIENSFLVMEATILAEDSKE